MKFNVDYQSCIPEIQVDKLKAGQVYVYYPAGCDGYYRFIKDVGVDYYTYCDADPFGSDKKKHILVTEKLSKYDQRYRINVTLPLIRFIGDNILVKKSDGKVYNSDTSYPINTEFILKESKIKQVWSWDEYTFGWNNISEEVNK